MSSPPLVKICGVTSIGDARHCVEAGADYIGLNIWPKSPRSVSIERAAEISSAIHEASHNRIVLVAVSPDHVELKRAIDLVQPEAIQIHGDWSRGTDFEGIPVWRAFSIGAETDLKPLTEWSGVPVLLDARVEGLHGGTGKTLPEELLRGVTRRYFLAGGLKPDNVDAIIRRVRPYGVDTASGVESSPGVKDHGLIRDFLAAVKGAG